MPNVVQRRVALLSDDGKFADSMTPQAVLDAVDQTAQDVESIEGVFSNALKVQNSLSDVASPSAARANIGAAPVEHAHQQDQVDGLVGALAAKADLVGGIIPTSQIPREALGDVVVRSSQAEMLALTSAQVQQGDICIRTDGAGSWILRDGDPGVLSSWVRLNSPTDAVTSVNQQVGDVTLNAENVNAVSPAQLSTAISGVQIEAAGYADQAAGSATAAASSATAAANSSADAVTARNGAQTAQTAAEKARSETEQIYVALGSISGTKTLTLAEANKPTGWDATLTASTDFVLPSLGNRILTCSLYLVAGTAGVTYRVLGSKASYGLSLVHSGALNGEDLVHLLHYGPRGWIVLAGAAALSVPAGWVS